jgi:hypothetical protein
MGTSFQDGRNRRLALAPAWEVIGEPRANELAPASRRSQCGAGFTPVRISQIKPGSTPERTRPGRPKRVRKVLQWRRRCRSRNGLRAVSTVTWLLCPRADRDRLRRSGVPTGRLECRDAPHRLAAARVCLVLRRRSAGLCGSASLGSTGSVILAHSVTSLPSTAVVAIGAR